MKKFVIKGEVPCIVYTVLSENDTEVLLKGYTHRIIKRVNKSLLEEATNENIKKEEMLLTKYETVNQNIRKTKVLTGTILHIDGDKEYLKSCMSFYKKVNVFAWGIYIKEKEVKQKILKILEELSPDIVVITGHDAYNGQGIKDLNNYENSKVYIDIVRTIRSKHSKENLVVIVGACASHYEALIASGANFASSPGRINIHTYDPAVVAIKVATTSCNKTIDFDSVAKHMIDGKKAIGGIETKGKMKVVY